MKTSKISNKSPQGYARIAGALYLIVIILGAAQQFLVRDKVIVSGDAAATAANIRSMESLWRIGIASELILVISAIVIALAIYILLKPVSRDLALLAAFFNLIAIAVELTSTLQLVEALYPLGAAEYLKAFTPDQLYAMTTLAIRTHGNGFGIALLFFGCFFPIAGYLIFKSGYFPKTIGILFIIPGISYLISSFALILAPAFADKYYFIMAGPALIGEVGLSLWLLVKGVNKEEWERHAQVS